MLKVDEGGKKRRHDKGVQKGCVVRKERMRIQSEGRKRGKSEREKREREGKELSSCGTESLDVRI